MEFDLRAQGLVSGGGLKIQVPDRRTGLSPFALDAMANISAEQQAKIPLGLRSNWLPKLPTPTIGITRSRNDPEPGRNYQDRRRLGYIADMLCSPAFDLHETPA